MYSRVTAIYPGNWVSAVEEADKLFRTAGDETLQLKQTTPVWQWLTDDNKWFDYGQEQSEKLGRCSNVQRSLSSEHRVICIESWDWSIALFMRGKYSTRVYSVRYIVYTV